MTTLPTIGGWTNAVTMGASTPANISVVASPGVGGVQTNDWMVLIITSGGAYSTTRKPSFDANWISLVPYGQVGAGTMCFGVFARKRLAGDGNTYAVTQSTAEATSTYTRFIFVRGADDIARWIIGTFNIRATNGTTTTNVATTISTTAANALALLLSGERTVATETDTQVTCSGGFTKIDYAMGTAAGAADHIVLSAIKAMAAPGATGASTVTYPNAHAANGIAGIIGIPSVPDAASGRPRVWTGTSWVQKPSKVWTGSAWVEKPVKGWTGSTWKTSSKPSPQHRVFPVTPPGTPTAYTDGTPTIRLGNYLYTFGATPVGWRCIGGRIYIPAASAASGKPVTIYAYLDTGAVTPPSANPPALLAAPLRSASITTPVLGWAEVFWEPFVIQPAMANLLFIAYEFTGAAAGTYIHSLAGNVSAIQADDGSPLYLAEAGFRSFFKQGSGSWLIAASGDAYYNSGIIVDEG